MAGDLIAVEAALARVLAAATPIRDVEDVALSDAFGRTLARDLVALRTQPPSDVSAMDGYGVRAGDLAHSAARVRLVGESAAGRGFAGRVNAGQCVRIFTGAPVPPGVDSVLLQEDAVVEGERIGAKEAPGFGRHIRRRGLDFSEGAPGLAAGVRLGPAELALAAAMNHARAPVVRKPRVAVLATGDELVAPGAAASEEQIVCSNNFAVAALVEAAGGVAVDLGIARDDLAETEAAIARARDCDALVTLGGASGGDRDHVKDALARAGMALDFWRLAMRPGKPLIHGTLGRTSVLGLPGNPVSSMVCALVFLVPLVRKLSGDRDPARDLRQRATLGADVKANDKRQDFLRATLARAPDGRLSATPHALQDSSLISVFCASQALLIRPPHAPAARAGEDCTILPLAPFAF